MNYYIWVIEMVNNNKGFTLVEMLACVGLLGLVLGFSLLVNKGTLSTSMTQIDTISDNEIYDAAELYVIEKNVTWIDNSYTCILVRELSDYGYFTEQEVKDIKNKLVKVTRDSKTLVVDKVQFVDICE